MRKKRFKSPPHREVPALAVFVDRIRGNYIHTGILHREDSGQLNILDLRWHENLRCEPATQEYHCVIPDLYEEEIDSITGLCRLIQKLNLGENTQKIPYAFGVAADTEINNTGDIILKNGLGLNCSSFVLVVFKNAGVPILNIEGWPNNRTGDIERQQQLLEMMKTGLPNANPPVPPAQPEHIAKVEASLPCIRVRPEEVAGAAMADRIPSTFLESTRGGRWILTQLPVV